MKKLGLLAVVMFLVVLVMAAPYAAAIEMLEINGKQVNYTKVLLTGFELWKNMTGDQDNITFNSEGFEWVVVPDQKTFSVELKTQLITDKEDAAVVGVQGSKGDVDPKSIIDTRTDEEKFAGDEYKNALPAPRPPGFESEGSVEETGKGNGLIATQGAQEVGNAANSAQQPGQAKASQSGTESVGSGSNAAEEAGSEIQSTSAAGAKEPGEAKKDKSGEKEESFFAKVLKWLFGK